MNEYYKINTNEQLDESFLNFENNNLDESNIILNSRYFERESKPKSEFDTKTDILNKIMTKDNKEEKRTKSILNYKPECSLFLDPDNFMDSFQDKIYKNENLFYNENIVGESENNIIEEIDENTREKTNKKNSIDNKNQEIEELNKTPETPKAGLEIEISVEKNDEETNENKKKLPKPPKQYEFNEIKDKILPKLNINTYEKINPCYIFTDNVEDLQKKMSDDTYYAEKKRNRDKEIKKNDPKKRGRKTKQDTSVREHTKNSEDNIIKKIKTKVIDTLLTFINNCINCFLSEEKIKSYVKIMKDIKDDKEPEKENLLKFLDYKKTINETKRETNLQFFKMPLKDFLSIDISPKFSTYRKDSNKIIINELLKNEQDNEILMFILNDLTFEDFIDIYTHKKELKSFPKLDESKINLINYNFIYVESLLEEVHKLNDENNYFSCFTSILYNLKRWFFIKQERNRTKL